MRLFELAKKYNVNGKDLIEVLQSGGFDVKSTLAAVDDRMVAWVEAQPREALGGSADGNDSESGKKPAKKKAAPKKKAKASVKPDSTPAAAAPTPEVEVDGGKNLGEPSEEESTEKQGGKPKKKRKLAAVRTKTKKTAAATLEGKEEKSQEAKQEEASEVKVEEKQDTAESTAEEPVEDNAVGDLVDVDIPMQPRKLHERKAKSESDRKAEKKAEKRKAREEVQSSRGADALKQLAKKSDSRKSVEAASDDEIASSGVVVDEEQEEKKAAAKHKRADFRSKAKLMELPAEFADISKTYTHSLSGGRGKGRRKGGRGTQNFRRSRRRSGRTVVRERDPNAVAQVYEGITLRDASTAMGIKLNEIVAFFMKSGEMMQVNDPLSNDDITLLAAEFEVNIEWRSEVDLEEQLAQNIEDEELSTSDADLVERPPIITFLGHVDHGKTSLLDKIRETRVAAGEAGGITQHIGAYCIEKNGQTITFLDTPGHEAFTAMRARGANLTDIAVLIVAADDGVMPQTEEAVSHARNAGVPIIVAINKCDMPSANPDKVRQELSTRLNLLPEEWGGQVGMINVSAHTGQGIDELLERILLESEILELKSNPDRNAIGHVIEAKVSESMGVVTTVLVHDGTMHRGDVVLCSAGYGKIKLMYDEYGNAVEEVGPGRPARIAGLSAVPEAGDRIYVMDDLIKARNLAEQREHAARTKALSRRAHVTLENLQAHLADGEVQELNVIIKADVMGSLEVLRKTLIDLSTDEVRIRVIHSAVGGINQADVILADASNAIIVGFHVVADQAARLQAASHGVQIRIYHIIYRLIEDMKAALEGMLAPEEKEIIQGQVEIRQVFKASRLGNIAGCYVTEGVVTRNSRLRVIRDNIVIYDGAIDSLKRVKDDAREVRAGFECGIKVAGYNDIREGDILEAYTIEEVARKLDS